jgi:hypothetical protein
VNLSTGEVDMHSSVFSALVRRIDLSADSAVAILQASQRLSSTAEPPMEPFAKAARAASACSSRQVYRLSPHSHLHMARGLPSPLRLVPKNGTLRQSCALSIIGSISYLRPYHDLSCLFSLLLPLLRFLWSDKRLASMAPGWAESNEIREPSV